MEMAGVCVPIGRIVARNTDIVGRNSGAESEDVGCFKRAGVFKYVVLPIAAVEDVGIVADLTRQKIASRSSIENVVARATVEAIKASAAQKYVTAVLSRELIVSIAAGEDVVLRTTVQLIVASEAVQRGFLE